MNEPVSKMGRPPLDGEVAMSAEEQKDRKRGLQELVRKRIKLRKIRQIGRMNLRMKVPPLMKKMFLECWKVMNLAMMIIVSK